MNNISNSQEATHVFLLCFNKKQDYNVTLPPFGSLSFPHLTMNRSTSLLIGATITLAATLLPVSSFAMKVPTVEPSSVFVTGALPAWANRHTNSGTADHREFHKNAEATLKTWKEQNKNRVGTEEYTAELRMKLASLSREHRAFHGWQNETRAEKLWQEKNASAMNANAIGGFPVTLSPELKTAISLISQSDFAPLTAEHRYEGSRPSARLMREQASFRGIVR